MKTACRHFALVKRNEEREEEEEKKHIKNYYYTLIYYIRGIVKEVEKMYTKMIFFLSFLLLSMDVCIPNGTLIQ